PHRLFDDLRHGDAPPGGLGARRFEYVALEIDRLTHLRHRPQATSRVPRAVLRRLLPERANGVSGTVRDPGTLLVPRQRRRGSALAGRVRDVLTSVAFGLADGADSGSWRFVVRLIAICFRPFGRVAVRW